MNIVVFATHHDAKALIDYLTLSNTTLTSVMLSLNNEVGSAVTLTILVMYDIV
nr:hypothetical protein [Alicyclobacillus hesperidum]